MTARPRSFLFDPVPVLPLAVARVLLGGTLLVAYGWLLPSFDRLLGPSGLLGAGFHDAAAGPTIGRSTTASFRVLQHVSSPALLWIVYASVLLGSLLFVVGYRTRLAGSVALLSHLLLHGRNEYVFWGWAEIITPFLVYVLLAPSHRALAVDAWRAGRRGSGTDGRVGRAATMPAWPLRLLQIHVCTVYVVAGWSRLDNPNWLDGSMTARVLADGTFSRFPAVAGDLAWWFAVITFVAWGLELVAPVLLWDRHARTATALALIGLHAGLEVLTKVGGWNVVMVAGLLTFLPPAWLGANRRSRHRGDGAGDAGSPAAALAA